MVGGGVAGLSAALAAADAGYEVVLVEKQAQLGGFLGQMKKKLPNAGTRHRSDFRRSRCQAQRGVRRSAHQGLLLGPDRQDRGSAGNVRRHAGNADWRFRPARRAIILPSGRKPYDTSKLVTMGRRATQRRSPTLKSKRWRPARASFGHQDRKSIQRVLFRSGCAGSRDAAHLPYCSSVCCMTTLKQMEEIRAKTAG